MKVLFGFIVLAGIAAQAETVRLECKASNPCQYANEGLEHCVSSIGIYGQANGEGVEVVKMRPENPTHEIYLPPQESKVRITKKNFYIVFNDETGDQWGQLRAIDGGVYAGTITVDQDFEFKVRCQDKSIGLE